MVTLGLGQKIEYQEISSKVWGFAMAPHRLRVLVYVLDDVSYVYFQVGSTVTQISRHIEKTR